MHIEIPDPNINPMYPLLYVHNMYSNMVDKMIDHMCETWSFHMQGDWTSKVVVIERAGQPAFISYESHSSRNGGKLCFGDVVSIIRRKFIIMINDRFKIINLPTLQISKTVRISLSFRRDLAGDFNLHRLNAVPLISWYAYWRRELFEKVNSLKSCNFLSFCRLQNYQLFRFQFGSGR